MIAKLKGIVDSVGEDFCVVDVNGVGYLVFASTKTLGKLVRGGAAEILIETIVREDSISLYGFFDAWEKEWFITLTKVQGVGSKVGLAILSVLAPSQLSQAVAAQDKASFTRANGVGPKLAARIVTELKDKIVTVPVYEFNKEITANASVAENAASEEAGVSVDGDALKVEDSISALVNLGYSRIEAYQKVSKVLAGNKDAGVSDIIRLALKEFAAKE